MSFRRFMREEIKKADRRYMEEEGEQDFQTNIAPLLQSETRSKNFKRYVAVLCPALAIILIGVFLLSFWNYEEKTFGDGDIKTQIISLSDANKLCTNFYFNNINATYIELNYNSKSNEYLTLKVAEINNSYKKIINIVYSDISNYQPPEHFFNKTETEYLGWPLIYSVQKAVEEEANKFQVHAELNTGAEKVYIEYEQTTTDEECDFLDFLAQTIIKK